METLDFVAIVSGLCALLMVVGSLFLLYKGVIKLENAAPADVLTAEFQRILKIQTRIPALALFVLAVIFMCVSVWSANIKQVRAMSIIAKLGTHPNSKILAIIEDELDRREFDSGGELSADILPAIKSIRVRVPLAGVGEIQKTLSISKAQGTVLDFGTLEIPVATTIKPTTNPAQIVPPASKLVPPDQITVDPPTTDILPAGGHTPAQKG